METNKKKVLGYSVDILTFEEALERVKEKLISKEKTHVVTINPEMIELAGKNSEFSQVLKTADLVIPDGSGIKLALKLRGIKQEQIPGIDFAKAIISLCAENNFAIDLIGAKEEIIQKTAIKLKEEFPNLKINYMKNGYFTSDEESEIIENISKSGARLVLAALGAPKQEFFIRKCMDKYPQAVYIGVGGSFDVWAGEVERAPVIFRIIGCEWLYRTLTQPQRIKRVYKTLPAYLFKIIIEAIQKRETDD